MIRIQRRNKFYVSYQWKCIPNNSCILCDLVSVGPLWLNCRDLPPGCPLTPSLPIEFSLKCELLQVGETQNKGPVNLGFIYSSILFLPTTRVVHFFGWIAVAHTRTGSVSQCSDVGAEGQHVKSHTAGNLDAVLEAGRRSRTVLLPTPL